MDFKSPLLHYRVMKVAQKLILTIAVLSLMLPVLVFSEDSDAVEKSGKCGDDLTWSFDESTGILTISGTGEMYELSPSPFAFDDSIKVIVIGAGATSISDFVFSNCTSLTSVDIPDTVTSIGMGAFSGCSSLTSISIPDSVSVIGSYVFEVCSSLTSITIPSSVTSIGRYPFSGCTSLENIDVDAKNITYSSVNGVLFDKDITELVCYPAGHGGETYAIPNSITSIIDGAFDKCSSLTSITIPDSVSSIGEFAFSDCTSLKSISILDSVKFIGSDAFEGCSSLTSIAIPNSILSIGEFAFRDCTSLTSIDVGNCSGISPDAFPDHKFYKEDGITEIEIGSNEFVGHKFKGDSISDMIRSDDPVPKSDNDRTVLIAVAVAIIILLISGAYWFVRHKH